MRLKKKTEMVEKRIKMEHMDMDYVVFGSGKENLIIVPGLSDSLTPVSQTGVMLYRQLKEFTSAFRIYIFSRKKDLPPGFSTRDMADDLYRALESLGLTHYSLLGLSQGGMIAQFFAIDHSHALKKTIIAVSLSKPTDTSQKTFNRWHMLSMQGEYTKLIIDTVRKSYPSGNCSWFRQIKAFLGTFGRSKSLNRFIIQSEACMNHNSHEELHRIKTPTLIIGGMKDEIVGHKAAAEMAEHIPGSVLKEYPYLGHDPLNHSEVIKDIYRFLIE
ncbi:MAG: alpha/beta fold hydrolase [Thermotogota bacterium]